MLKLFELKDGKLNTLFHAIHHPAANQPPSTASRVVPIGEWVEATQKPVRDGSDSPKYLSGFHIFCCDLDYIANYCSRFRKERELVLVDVCVNHVRVKPTNKHVLLAATMYIPEGFQPIKASTLKTLLN
jgi:hypothetical protein